MLAFRTIKPGLIIRRLSTVPWLSSTSHRVIPQPHPLRRSLMSQARALPGMLSCLYVSAQIIHSFRNRLLGSSWCKLAATNGHQNMNTNTSNSFRPLHDSQRTRSPALKPPCATAQRALRAVFIQWRPAIYARNHRQQTSTYQQITSL